MSEATSKSPSLDGQRCVIASLAGPLQAAIRAALANAGAEVQVLKADAAGTNPAKLAEFPSGRPPTVWIQGLTANPAESVVQLTLEAFRRCNEDNLENVFLGTQKAFETMSEGGTIVNVFACTGRRPGKSGAALAAASAGLEVHTRASAIEGAARDPQIRANGLALSGTLWQPNPASPELRAAGASVVFLASEAAAYCTGSTLVHETSGSYAS